MMPTTRATSIPSRRVTIRASSMVARCSRLGRGAAIAGSAAARRGARLTEAVDLQTVGAGHEAVSAADLRLQGGDPGAQELHHPAADRAHQVVVPLPAVDVLVEVTPAAEPLLAGKAARHQQVQVAVHRGPRDLQPAAPRRRQQVLGVDVAVLAKDLVEQGEPLGGDPVAPLSEEAQEAFFLALVGHLGVIETSSQYLSSFWTGSVLFVNG